MSNYLRKHSKRTIFFSLFSLSYFTIAQKTRTAESDLLRAGLAGASANMICELSFHAFDTINTRTKVHNRPITSLVML